MRRGWAMAAVAVSAALWGGMFVVSRVVLGYVSALPLVELRIVIALIVLAPFAVRQRIWRLTGRQVAAIAVIGVVGYTASLSLQFIGTAATSASLGSLITASAPSFIVLFGAIGGERPTRRNVLALAIALLGVTLIAGIDVPSGVSLIGIGALVAAAVTWALYTVLGRRLARSVSLLATLYWGLLAGGIALLPLALPVWPDLTRLSPGVWLGIVYLGAVAMAVAFFLWNYGFAHLSPDTGAVFGLLQPVVGTALGALLLGERLTALTALGGMLILAGAALAGFSATTARDTPLKPIQTIPPE